MHLVRPRRRPSSRRGRRASRCRRRARVPAPLEQRLLNNDGYLRKVVRAAMESTECAKVDRGRVGGRGKPLHWLLPRRCTRRQLEAGRPPAVGQAQLGHSTIALTIDTYGKWTLEAMRAEAQRDPSASTAWAVRMSRHRPGILLGVSRQLLGTPGRAFWLWRPGETPGRLSLESGAALSCPSVLSRQSAGSRRRGCRGSRLRSCARQTASGRSSSRSRCGSRRPVRVPAMRAALDPLRRQLREPAPTRAVG